MENDDGVSRGIRERMMNVVNGYHHEGMGTDNNNKHMEWMLTGVDSPLGAWCFCVSESRGSSLDGSLSPPRRLAPSGSAGSKCVAEGLGDLRGASSGP